MPGRSPAAEVMQHESLLDRAIELATQIAEVPITVMSGLKQIYVAGAAMVRDAALAAEMRVAESVAFSIEELGDKRRQVTSRNHQHIAK